MRTLRPIFGALVLLTLAGAAGAGLWTLSQQEGPGLSFAVRFADPRGLEEDAPVIYGDRVVGRVTRVRRDDAGSLVEARISNEHAAVLREGSRFWIAETTLGPAALCFVNPRDAGSPASEGASFKGLPGRPEPEEHPVERPRVIERKPVWLCEARATTSFRSRSEAWEVRRKSAALVVATDDTGLLVAAPSWLAAADEHRVSTGIYVELPGGETRVAEIAAQSADLLLLRVMQEPWEAELAPWSSSPTEDEPCNLLDFDGAVLRARRKGEVVQTGAPVENGLLLLNAEGVPAGFATPGVSPGSPRFRPLDGLADLLRTVGK